MSHAMVEPTREMNPRSDPLARAPGALARFIDATVQALLDPARNERAFLALLLAYVAMFTAFALIANGSSDVHHDFGELLGWAREPSLGYNHPPLSAWIAAAWFMLFSASDWAAYLLATINAATALWIAWRLAGDWLEAEKRVAAFTLLTLIPFFTFNALVFNANTLLLPLWAAATLFFLRSLRRCDAANAALAGLACGAALLTKYWSVYLVAGFAAAALAQPHARRYFLSPAPWASAAVALVVIAPHLAWIARGGSSTLAFAESISSAEGASAWRSVAYLRDSALYVAAALIAYACLRPSRNTLAQSATGATPDLRALAALFWTALLLPATVNVVVPSRLTAAWTAPNWTLLPVLLLAPAAIVVTRRYLRRLVGVAIALPLAVLALAPAIALAWHLSDPKDGKAHYRQLAQAIETRWRAQARAPLTMIGGDQQLASGAVFYLTDAPSTPLDQIADKRTPLERLQLGRITGERARRNGIVYLCFAEDARCRGVVERAIAGAPTQRDEIELTRRYLGIDGKAERYVLFMMLPRP